MSASASGVPTYLDTSALMRSAEGRATPCTPRNAAIRSVLDEKFADPTRRFACSELTILEWHSNVTTRLRSAGEPEYDEAWWDDVREDLMDKIYSKSVEVLPTPSNALQHAMALVTVATKGHGRGLRAWDALHGLIASRWSFELGTVVELYTSDGDFDSLNEVPGMAKTIKVVSLDVLAGTREGADRRNK